MDVCCTISSHNGSVPLAKFVFVFERDHHRRRRIREYDVRRMTPVWCGWGFRDQLLRGRIDTDLAVVPRVISAWNTPTWLPSSPNTHIDLQPSTTSKATNSNAVRTTSAQHTTRATRTTGDS